MAEALRRLTLALAGVLGAGGVGLSAMAAHGADARLLGTAAAIALAHAPVLVGLAAGWSSIRTAPVAALLVGLGALLFTSDLVARHVSGQGLFPMSAPSGGILMMAGWAAIALAAVLPKR